MPEVRMLGFGEEIFVKEIGDQNGVGESLLLDAQIDHILVSAQ
jgi:hypothetical protein